MLLTTTFFFNDDGMCLLANKGVCIAFPGPRGAVFKSVSSRRRISECMVSVCFNSAASV